MLSSSIFDNSAQTYLTTQQANPELIDLVISGLPAYFESKDLKKASGCRHIVSAEVDVDKIRGVCIGTGRIQIRLNQHETADYVKRTF